MMKLYGTIASPHVGRVVLAARHKKIDLEIEWPAGGLKSAAYLAINPLGLQPAFQHDDQFFIESEVICEYLEDLFPTPTILPGDAAARARARTVSRVIDLYFWPDVNQLFHQYFDPTWLDAAEVEACKARLAARYRILDGLMTVGGPWAAGEFSLADCTLLPRVLMIQKTVGPKFGIPDLAQAGPTLTAWWKQVNATPLTSAFLPECYAATDAYLAKAMAQHA